MLSLLNRNKHSVGLDIGSSALKAVELRASRKGGYELAHLGIEELSPDCIVDGVIISKIPVSDGIARIFAQQEIKNDRINTSISGHSVIVKKISLPVQSEEELAESIRWEAEQYIPFDIADVNLDYQVLGENTSTGNLDILLVAVKKDKITDYTSVIKMAGKVPVLIDVDAFALQNAYEINYEPTGSDTVALLDVGASTMTINIVSGTDFLFTRDVGVGGHQYTEFMQKEFNLGHAQAQALKHGEPVEGIDPKEAGHVIESVTEILCLEIQKDLRLLQIHHDGGPHRPDDRERRCRSYAGPDRNPRPEIRHPDGKIRQFQEDCVRSQTFFVLHDRGPGSGPGHRDRIGAPARRGIVRL